LVAAIGTGFSNAGNACTNSPGYELLVRNGVICGPGQAQLPAEMGFGVKPHKNGFTKSGGEPILLEKMCVVAAITCEELF
jgi:hypothetical protein